MKRPEAQLDAVEAGPADAKAAVVFLHGLGADGYDFHPIVGELGLRDESSVRFVFPHAPPRPVTLNAGQVMRAWYDITELSMDGRSHDVAGIRESAALVERLLERELERGVPAGRLLLAGYSQGGALAIHVALRFGRRLAGLVALSSYLLLSHTLEAEAEPANRDLPIFMGHGEFDPVVPMVAGQLCRDRLTGLGYRVDWRTYPVPHAVHPREIADLGRFIDARLR